MSAAVHSGKFGVHPEQLDDAVALAQRRGLAVRGLHTHLGSDIYSLQPFLQALEVLLSLAEHLPAVDYVDLGGGLVS